MNDGRHTLPSAQVGPHLGQPFLIGGGGALVGSVILLLGRPALGWSVLAFCIAVAVVEMSRRSRSRPPPPLVTHAMLLAWAGIVLAPWIARGPNRYWPVPPEGYVLADLPGTWTINLAALLGIVVATLATIPRDWLPVPARLRIRWSLAVLAVIALVLVYVAGSLAAGRRLTSLWRLGTSSRYADFAGSAGLGILDIIPVVLMVFVLGLTAVRRTYAQRPSAPEIAVVLLAALLLLGLAVRYRLIILVAGWFVLQWWSGGPSGRLRSVTLRVAGTAAVGVVLLSLAGYVSAVRQGNTAGSLGQQWDRAWANLDVVSSAELMTYRGVSPGMLEGTSYTQLPALWLPRALAPDKPYPAAQDAVNAYLNPTVGYSAPAWFEGWLNFGVVGAFAAAVVIALLLLGAGRRATRRAHASTPWFVVLALSPVFPLLGYQLFSRLLAFQATSTLLAFVVGVCGVAVVTRRVPITAAKVLPGAGSADRAQQSPRR